MLLRVDRAVRLLERLQAGGGPGSADHPHVAVDRARAGQLPHERRIVRRVERREHALRDLSADRTEVRDHPSTGRPAEAVVVHDDRGLTPTELLVEDLADAGVPLGPVAVVAEHVLRCDLQGRVLRARRPDDERLRPGATWRSSRPTRLRRLRAGRPSRPPSAAPSAAASPSPRSGPCRRRSRSRRSRPCGLWTVIPVMPADGLFLFLTLPPAYCAKAACAPPMSSS